MAGMIEELIRRFYDDLWNRWDDQAVNEVLDPDFQFRGSLGVEVRGRQEWRDYRDLIRGGSADFHNDVIDLVAQGGRAAARLRYTGHHTGPLLGIAATGRPFTYAGAAFFTAGDRQLTSAWVLGDLDGLRRQLTSSVSSAPSTPD
jgi:predicted ester cyclase